MQENEFDLLARKITDAKNPEDVFGSLEGADDQLKAARSIYRHLSRFTHPDLNNEVEVFNAQEAFIKLSQLWETAQTKIKAGTYGEISPEPTVTIRTRAREYEVFATIAQTDFCNVYSAKYKEGGSDIPVLFQAARSPLDNDFVENETRVLSKLAEADSFDKFYPYFPNLVDSFTFEDSGDHIRRGINVFAEELDELYSFAEVNSAYPNGIDPKDMAWIFRRVLVGLGFAHQNGIIHGAILPENIFIQPEKHGLVIKEWSYAVVEPEVSSEHLLAVPANYESWYPAEVLRKELVTPALDIYLGSRNMVQLLGGDPLLGKLSDVIHPRLRNFFRGCLLPSANQRPQDAWNLLTEFDELIEGLWGPKKFHPFSMPKKAEGR